MQPLTCYSLSAVLIFQRDPSWKRTVFIIFQTDSRERAIWILAEVGLLLEVLLQNNFPWHCERDSQLTVLTMTKAIKGF